MNSNSYEYKQHKAFNALEDNLYSLEKISRSLSAVGLYVLAASLLNFFVVVLMALFVIFFINGTGLYYSQKVVFVTIPIIFSLICLLFGISSAYSFDRKKRVGEAYFEELIDQMHILDSIDETNELSYQIWNEEVLHKVRIQLKLFAKKTDLPFIPGKYGPAVFAVFNIVMTLIVLFLAVSFSRQIFY